MVMMRSVAVVRDGHAAFKQRELRDVGGRQRRFRRCHFCIERRRYGVRNTSGAQTCNGANAIAAAQHDAPFVDLPEKRAAATLALYPTRHGVSAVYGHWRNANDRVRLFPGVLDDVRYVRSVVGNRGCRRDEHECQRRRNDRPHHFTCTPA